MQIMVLRCSSVSVEWKKIYFFKKSFASCDDLVLVICSWYEGLFFFILHELVYFV